VPGRPFTLIGGAAVETLEALAALGFGLSVVVEMIAGRTHDPATGFGVVTMTVLAGAGMLAVARGLLLARQWGRSPAVLTQLFALFIAYNLIQSGQPLYGWPLGAGAAAALVMVLSPPTTKALYAGD
jgi:hypothetical protein